MPKPNFIKALIQERDKKEGYFLDQDDSCHWYIVQESHRTDWEAWKEQEEDENIPEYATFLGCSPNNVVFDNYKIT